ncbi:MAG: serine/threonine dehydratase [Glaciecola sp.]|nr:serine/threonine dehydratase [Glaciecola sp.]
MATLPEFTDVQAAYERIKAHVTQTPVVTSSLLNAWLGHTVLFKAECLQRTGSFKLRGATNFLHHYCQTHGLPEKIVANSSGNHAQAVAYAGSMLNIPVDIYSTESISPIKAAATQDYGAKLHLFPTRLEADAAVAAAAETEGVLWIPPFNHADIIAGQGTAVLEAITQTSEHTINAVFTPCGGGGLTSGALLTTRALIPEAQIIGVEPQNANDASISLQQGSIYTLPAPAQTLADGAATPAVGDITFEFLQQLDGFYEVNETQIAYWTQWLQHLLKLHIEPTCCMTMAGAVAWLTDQPKGQTVLVMLSGGNIATSTMQQIYAVDYLTQPPYLD